MSATQATVTSKQVAVRYRRDVGSLSIDMSTDTRPINRSRCVGQHINRHIGRVLVEMLVDMLTNISVKHRSICRPRVGRYVGRGVYKLHVIQILYTVFTVKIKSIKCTPVWLPRISFEARN